MDRVNVTVPEGLVAGILSAQKQRVIFQRRTGRPDGATYEFYSTDEDVFTVNRNGEQHR